MCGGVPLEDQRLVTNLTVACTSLWGFWFGFALRCVALLCAVHVRLHLVLSSARGRFLPYLSVIAIFATLCVPRMAEICSCAVLGSMFNIRQIGSGILLGGLFWRWDPTSFVDPTVRDVLSCLMKA
jgi:hypothetical protein